MSKPKYSSEFKIMVAEAYLNGEGEYSDAAEPPVRTSVSHW